MKQEGTNAQIGHGTKDCDKKTCRYWEGIQEGAFSAEKKMKKRASHFIEEAIRQINKKHGLELNVDNYVNNLIFAMEWGEGRTLSTPDESNMGLLKVKD